MKNWIFLITIVLFTACNSVEKKTVTNQEAKKNTNTSIVFVGTYTQKLPHVNGKASGIYTCLMDNENGSLTIIDSATGIVNPSFLTISPNKKYLYAVGEVAGSGDARLGKVHSFKITEGGKLLIINELPSYGNAPCHISTDNFGELLFVANYLTGNVVSYRIKADGSIGDTMPVDKRYSESKWAHMIIQGPGSAFFSIDKGADRIYKYLCKYGCNGIGQVNYYSTAKGAGPRHMDFSPNGRFAYVINENNSTINAYTHDTSNYNLKEIQTITTLPSDFKGQNTCADIHVHPNGKFVYGSNRGHNSIAIFKINENTGQLEVVGHEFTQGEIPRNFMISRDGKLLLAANQNTDNVVAFKIDETTGKLTPTGQNSKIPTPVCLKVY